MATLEFMTVYKTYAAQQQDNGAPAEAGSLTIKDGAVIIAFSNKETEPTSTDDFQPDLGPGNDNEWPDGVYEIRPAARWMLLVSFSGTPVVNEFRVTLPTGTLLV